MEPLNFHMAAGEIGVWIWELSESAGSAQCDARILSGDELERGLQFIQDRDRCRYYSGRAGLRRRLGFLSGAKPEDLRFIYSRNGKPSLDHPGGEAAIGFNLSHSGGYAMLAVGPGLELGVDIEAGQGGADLAQMSAIACSDKELSWLNQRPSQERHQAFLRIWTLKEAMLKARSLGLSQDLKDFSVIPLDQGLALTSGFDGVAPGAWRTFSFAPAPGLQASLAYVHPGGREYRVALKSNLDYPYSTTTFEGGRHGEISLHV